MDILKTWEWGHGNGDILKAWEWDVLKAWEWGCTEGIEMGGMGMEMVVRFDEDA